jgi:hypothetical protein
MYSVAFSARTRWSILPSGSQEYYAVIDTREATVEAAAVDRGGRTVLG